MYIVWGTTHAGKVDEVPGGLFHVVTQFGHVYYIPLIPISSHLVVEKLNDGSFRGVKIPMSFKSILAGWVRGLSVVGLIASAIGLFVSLASRKGDPFDWVLWVGIGMVSAAALFVSYKLFTKASYERAIQLATLAGYTDLHLMMIEVAYGRLTAAQADEELARREQVTTAQLSD